MLTLVDTSAWIHSLRPQGDAQITARVRGLLVQGDAAWCPIVKLELWNGARGEHEKAVLREMEKTLPELDISADVWTCACDLARKVRKAGFTVPATDLLVIACARHHRAAVEHADTHFAILTDL